jgi:hypothetical protein
VVKENGKESKTSVGGNPVRTGAEGVFALPADWRLGRGLRLAEKSDLRIGPANPQTRNAFEGFAGPE